MTTSASRTNSIWLNRYVWVVVTATFFLIFVGAMVTSKGAGMAVPDWPLSFGSLNPPGWWKIDHVFWEHGHRLTGAAIGLLTIGLAIVLWRSYPNSPIRWLGIAALCAVCIQGLMGGLRVTQISITFAIIHGCFGQALFALMLLIAAVTSPGLTAEADLGEPARLRALRRLSLGLVFAVYIQLILGAVMRHLKAGLAIPDFPLAMGRLIPEFTHYGIVIHYMHRVWALAVLTIVIVLLVKVFCHFRTHTALVRISLLLGVLLVIQISLGASVIWMIKAPLPTSLHVLNGAAVLGTGVFLAVRVFSLTPRGALLA